MSTKQLAQNGIAPVGMTAESFPIYSMARGNTFEEAKFSSSTTSIHPAGTTTIISCKPSNNDRYKIAEDWLEFKVDNAGPQTCTWRHPYGRIKAIRLLWSNDEVDYLKSYAEIMQRYRIWFGDKVREIEDVLMYLRRDSSNSLTGDVDTVSVGQMTDIPLFPLFPYMYGMDSKICSEITYEVTWQDDTNTASDNGIFVLSDGTTDCYGDSLSYKDIKIKRQFYRLADVNQTINKGLKLMKINHEFKRQTVQWASVTGSQNITTFKFSDFASHSLVRGALLYIDAPTLRTAFNSAGNGRFISGPQYIGWKIVRDGKDLLDYSQPVDHLKPRRDYAQNVHHNMFAKRLPQALINQTDDFSKYHYGIGLTYIDFSNAEIFEQHEMSLSGISTDNNIEIWVYVSGLLPSPVLTTDNVIVNCALEYFEEIVPSGNGFVVNRKI